MHRLPLFACVLLALIDSASMTHATPGEDAAAYHRDFQSNEEGVVIGVLEGETSTFGQAGPLKKDGPPVDADTLFEIGSITKTFTEFSSLMRS
jgi:CubicO group peptidase (beta-lactamase class C family)